MKAVKLAVIGAMLMSTVAAANDVYWSLTGPTEVAKGDAVAWQASVAVTGENAGLAGYAFSLAVGPGAGPTAGTDGQWGTADDENVSAIVLSPATWVASFNVQGQGPGSVQQTGSAGGPGMNVLASPGTNNVKAGELLQVGAGYLFWTPWNGADGQTAGVGRDEAKAQLLANAAGAYVLNAGTIPTASLAGGTYTAVLIPVRARVLRADLNYAQAQSGFLMMEAAGTGSSFQFTVMVPPIPGDFDADGYVDVADLNVFLACSAGPVISYAGPGFPAGCTLVPDGEGMLAADFDTDGDVDSADFAVFQRCLSFDLPGDPNCAN
jgi:hypothetical protein